MKLQATIIILTNFLFCGYVNDPMNINYISTSASSIGMGGVYNPDYSSKKLIFSHLSKFGGLYTLDAIQYNNIVFAIHGLEDVPNTTLAWNNMDSDGPSANEIDYSKIDYFSIKDYSLVVKEQIKNKYDISIRGTFSKNYNHHGFGLGLNVATKVRKFKKINYYLGINDIVSFKKWSTSNLEFYQPKIMFSMHYNFPKLLNVLTLYGTYDNQDYTIDYRFGSRIDLTDNINIFFGKSELSQFSVGFSISNELFNIDYSYIASDSNLPFNDSYNIGLGININNVIKKSENFSP